MVIASRIQYVRGLANLGHTITLKFTTGQDQLKVKIWIGDQAGETSVSARKRIVTVIDSLQELAGSGIVHDRGHKHSAGFSMIEIFMRDASLSPTSSAPAPSSVAAPLPLASTVTPASSAPPVVQ